MSPQPNATYDRAHPTIGLVTVDGRSYPLRAAHIRARAEGGLALTTLVQEFHNPYDESLEVIYTMPLPADGAVLGYTITMGDRVVRGEIEVREAAEARYREALYQGKTAGLLEEDRPDTFQQRLGNIPAKTDVKVEIDVLQPVAFLTGTQESAPSWEYRFPTVAAVRYEGAPGRVPDAGRLDVDRAEDGSIPARFGLSLIVADESATYVPVTSTSHAITAGESPGGVQIELAGDARLDRDLVVRWVATTPTVGVRMVEGRGVAGDDGRYALLTITPPFITDVALPRDLTILLDSSGSMSGLPIDLAKQVIERLLRTLGDRDRFEVLSFSNSVQRLTRGMVAATPQNLEKSIRDVNAIIAGGGTEMAQAMAEALRTLRPESQRQVVLVTDGQIGFEKEVIGLLSTGPDGVRVHVVGIGYAPNRSLTAFLARAGRGLEVIAGDEHTSREAADRLAAATVRPILTDVRISGNAVEGFAPEKPRDVLAGHPLVVAVELKQKGGAIQVQGNLAGQKKPWSWTAELPAAGENHATHEGRVGFTPLPIGALYGRESIADLDAKAGSDSRHAEMFDMRIEQLGLRHRITSRRTSLVAIFEEPSTDPLAPRRRERLAVELPAGLSAEGLGLYGIARVGVLNCISGVGDSLAMPKAMLFDAELTDSSRKAWAFKKKFARAVPIEGTVIHRQGAEIVIEFEVPDDGFELPKGRAEVQVNGRKVGDARIVTEKSSARGPHPKGVLVRLALRLEGMDWPPSAEVLAGTGPGLMTLALKDIPADGPETPAR